MKNEGSYPYTSLCRVIDGVVERLADIDDDEIHVMASLAYRVLEWQLSDRFYVPNNFFGIWNWRLQKNSVAVAKFDRDRVPIEIIILPDCRDDETLMRRLSNGVNVHLSSGKALISYTIDHENYCGVLCTDEDFDSDGKIKVETSQLFKFNERNIIRVAGKFFYSKLTLETVDKISDANAELERIKRETADKISEANAELKRIKRETADKISEANAELNRIERETADKIYDANAQIVRIKLDISNFTKLRAELKQEIEYLQSARDEFSAQPLPTPTTTNALKNTTHSTSNFIQRILEKVVSRAQQVNSLQKRTSFQKFLFNYTVDYLYKEIAKENYVDDIIVEVIKEYPELLDEYQTVIKERADAERERIERETADKISEANAELDRLKRDIADFTKRRAELEQEIEYLQSARDEFSARPIASPAPPKFYRPGRVIGSAAPADDINDFIYAFEDALGMTGNEDSADLAKIDAFAKYLRAAFDNNTPLLLAGTRARAIADAFSVALTGRIAALIDCAGVKCLDDLSVCSSGDDKIIAAINPFAPDFIAYLPELVGIDGKFIFALHPFVEDLRLEPRSLYNYFLPVFTDLVLDDRMSADKRIKKLLRSSTAPTECAALFAKFPLAYINGRDKHFLDELKDDNDVGDRLRAFLGDADE